MALGRNRKAVRSAATEICRLNGLLNWRLSAIGSDTVSTWSALPLEAGLMKPSLLAAVGLVVISEPTGTSNPLLSTVPRSQWLMGVTSPGRPMPTTPKLGSHDPARLSQSTSSMTAGFENAGEPPGSVDWYWALFCAVE